MFYQITMVQHLSVLLTSPPYLTPPDLPPFNHCAFLWVLEQAQLVPASDFTWVVPYAYNTPPTFSHFLFSFRSLLQCHLLRKTFLDNPISKILLVSPPPNIPHPFIWLYFSLQYFSPNILFILSLLHFNVTSIGQGITVYPQGWKQCLVYNST